MHSRSANKKNNTAILSISFDESPSGTYTNSDFHRAWGPGTPTNGLEEGRVAVVEEGGMKSLRVAYPKGSVGPGEGGAQWVRPLGGSYEELCCSYRLRFGEGFDFARGGKLPGLAGGAMNTGGSRPDGTDGFSARMMWRPEGAIVQYVYHPDQPTIYGEDFQWNDHGKPLHFQPGRWYRVEHHIGMNTPGKRDGFIRCRLDGKEALLIDHIRFRNTDMFAIDAFYFSTFFGGADKSWAARKDEYLYFRDFVVTSADNDMQQDRWMY